MGVVKKIIDGQKRLCKMFDTLLPSKYSVDGNQDFMNVFVPKHLTTNLKIYDIGGGKNPYITKEVKKKLSLVVVGLDINKDELLNAPPGIYDEIICADIAQYKGMADADLVICQALLEHVRDVDKAIASLATIVKPEGKIVIFVPSKNALYARLNRMLPEAVKKRLLYSIFPQSRGCQGFPSYYNKCSPKDFSALTRQHGLQVEEAKFYYISAYFSFFFPIYFLWRIWVFIFHFIAGEQAAETFSMTLKRISQKE